MKRGIIYCTNREKLKRVNIRVRKEFWYPRKEEEVIVDPILLLDTDRVFVMLVYDQIFKVESNQEEIEELINKSIEGSKFHFVYHNEGHELKEFLGNHPNTLLSQGFEDHHELGADFKSKYYIKLNKIVKKQEINNEDFEELWKDFDQNYKLEEDLNALHQDYKVAYEKGVKMNLDSLIKKRDKLLNNLM